MEDIPSKSGSKARKESLDTGKHGKLRRDEKGVTKKTTQGNPRTTAVWPAHPAGTHAGPRSEGVSKKKVLRRE